MRLRYLAILPESLLDTNTQVTDLLNLNGWSITHQEARDFGHEVWVTLELDVPTPSPRHSLVRVFGDRSVKVLLPGAQGGPT